MEVEAVSRVEEVRGLSFMKPAEEMRPGRLVSGLNVRRRRDVYLPLRRTALLLV
jgi:hypothetical protein